MMIEVERMQSADLLRRHVWTFSVAADYSTPRLLIRLDRWQPQSRQTKRHKWTKDGEGWKFRHHNSVVHHGGWRAPAADVPLPDGVLNEVRNTIMATAEIKGAFDPKEPAQ